MALRQATEEAMSIRYMLQSLGIPVTEPTRILGDNMSVIQNATNPDAEIKKKHVTISFHVVREAIAAGFIEPWWVESGVNVSDILTKQLPRDTFLNHCLTLFPSAAKLHTSSINLMASKAERYKSRVDGT